MWCFDVLLGCSVFWCARGWWPGGSSFIPAKWTVKIPIGGQIQILTTQHTQHTQHLIEDVLIFLTAIQHELQLLGHLLIQPNKRCTDLKLSARHIHHEPPDPPQTHQPARGVLYIGPNKKEWLGNTRWGYYSSLISRKAIGPPAPSWRLHKFKLDYGNLNWLGRSTYHTMFDIINFIENTNY